MKHTPGGWLERVNTALADYGLEVYIDRKDGDKCYVAFCVVDPKSPEAVAYGTHSGTGCC